MRYIVLSMLLINSLAIRCVVLPIIHLILTNIFFIRRLIEFL